MQAVSLFRPGTEADAVDGVVPRQVAEPDTREAFAQVLAHASRERMQTVIRGGGTKLGWGRLPSAVDLVVGTARLDRLVAHRHGDLTVTVQAGMRLRDLNAALRAQRQWLPIESAFEGATVGGMVATNESGPSRHRNGTPRDLVIGITLALTDGRLVKSGGTVVKNVAGYDLGRLVSGSHGSLAGIADVTFKLMPIPAASATLTAMYDPTQAGIMTQDVAALLASQIEAAAFDVSVSAGTAPYRLALRVATSPAATEAQVAAARAIVRGETFVGTTAEAELGVWRNHLDGPWRGDAAVRFSWLPAALPRVVALVEEIQHLDDVGAALTARAAGTGLLRLSAGVDGLAAAIGRVRANPHVGNVVVLKAPRALKERVDVWGPPRSDDAVLRQVKQMFDPTGILNAGRGPV